LDTDLTVEAQARADAAVDILGLLYDDIDSQIGGLLPLLRRLFADDYEIAYGRGYDQGHEDGTFAPRVIDLGTPPIVLPTPRPLEVSEVGRLWESLLARTTSVLGLACVACGKPARFEFRNDPVTVRLMHVDWQATVYDHDAAVSA